MAYLRHQRSENYFIIKEMARPERFELPTPWFVARYSIQLSYGRADNLTDAARAAA
jgi:hypothetical protein